MNFQESISYSRSTSTTPISSLRPRTRRKISGLEEGETLFAADGVIGSGISSISSSNNNKSNNERSTLTPYDSPAYSRSSSPTPDYHRYLSHRANITSSSSFAQTRQDFQEDINSTSNTSNSQDPLGSLSDLWGNSWTAIQGLASNVLGANDSCDRSLERRRGVGVEGERRRGGGGGGGNRRGPPAKGTLRSWAAARSVPPSDWGPSDTGAESRIGVGSREERDALVRARKRQDLLTGGALSGEDTAGYQNAAGDYKRRVSDDRGDGIMSSSSSSVPPPAADERDALVYLHQVQASDTLAGISIKYNCPAAIVRKANRMWPNDSVQIRKIMMIPVDACALKGRKVSGPTSGVDAGGRKTFMEEDGGDEEDVTDSMNGNIVIPSDTISTTAVNQKTDPFLPTSDTCHLHRPTSSSVSSQASNTDPPWRHDSWVLLPNSAAPTQIARLPRRTLGFFPPARRKSITFSDTSGVTPRASFDIQSSNFSPGTPPPPPLPPSNHLFASVTAAAAHTATANTNTDYFARTSAGTVFPSIRNRSHSNTSSSTSAVAAAAASPSRPATTNTTRPPSYALRGPGGVGTLGKSVRAPGPAQDGLNKIFGPHLPNLAPPPNSQFVPWVTEETGAPNDTNAAAAATASSMYGSSPAFDIENVGGAIEGWMRKMATHASRAAASALAEPKSTPTAANNSGFASLGVLGGLGISRSNSRSNRNSSSSGRRQHYGNHHHDGRGAGGLGLGPGGRGRIQSGGGTGGFGNADLVDGSNGNGSGSGRGRGRSGEIGIGMGEGTAGDLIELTDSLELAGNGNIGGGGGSGGTSGAALGPGVDGGNDRLRGRTAGSLLARAFSPAGGKGGKGD